MIQIGINAFDVNPEMFRRTVNECREIADRLVIVWGQFAGYEKRWTPPPPYCQGKADLLIESKDRLPQHESRDLSLDGVQPGDIFIRMDSDQYIGPSPRSVKEYLNKISKEPWDTLQAVYLRSNYEYEQSAMFGFRIPEGEIKHSHGQLLMVDGKTMTSDNGFNVIKADPVYLHVFHHRKQGTGYRERQRSMWAYKGQ